MFINVIIFVNARRLNPETIWEGPIPWVLVQMITLTLADSKGTLERVFHVRPLSDEGVAVCSTEQTSNANVLSDLVKLKKQLERLAIENSELREELASISGPEIG